MTRKFTFSLIVGAVLSAGPAQADPEHSSDEAEHEPVAVRLIMPNMDAARGRELYATKGCLACHSVNGVGGEDASSLDAHDMEPYMNWRRACGVWRRS